MVTEYETNVLRDLSAFLLDLSEQEKRELVARTAEARHDRWCIAKVCGEPCQGPKMGDIEMAKHILSDLTKVPGEDGDGNE